MYPEKIIFYKQEDKSILICPFIECGIPLYEIARKDVPFGLPFKILDSSILPNDTEFMQAWDVDFSEPDGYGIGNHRWFIENAKKQIQNGIKVKENEILIQRMKDELFSIEGVNYDND